MEKKLRNCVMFTSMTSVSTVSELGAGSTALVKCVAPISWPLLFRLFGSFTK